MSYNGQYAETTVHNIAYHNTAIYIQRDSSVKIILLIFLLCINAHSLAERCKVVRVIDGDTFEINTGDKVRIIGINAPEISDIFGLESKYYLTNLIENQYVDLKVDPINKDKDQYQRLLRYVQIGDLDVNKKMIQDGYAFAYLKYRFIKHDEYRDLQYNAMNQKIGIWSNDEHYDTLVKSKINQTHFNSKKMYIIGFLIVSLILVGLYSYIKK